MRLLRVEDNGSFTLTENFVKEEEIPKYAVLSHRWLADREEVNFDDMTNGAARRKVSGYEKIQFCGEQAVKEGLQYIWVDTCCINKSSSQELQEAITTMFEWYQNSSRCYVYLMDVSADEDAADDAADEAVVSQPWGTAFCKSSWFTRGWTLQELLAPTNVIFFSGEGKRLGNRTTLQHWIHEITGIPYRALQGEPLSTFSVAERLSWAQSRLTTRKEDKAYSLLGIFNVFMLSNYGEGDYAWIRLQKILEKKYPDSPSLDHARSRLPVASAAAFNSAANQEKAECLPDTRVQLLSDIAAWANGADDKSVFWLDGAAGTGKSTIARSVARDCYDRGRLGGSFFFTSGGGDCGHADKLVTTLASQLLDHIPAVREHICKAVSAHHTISEVSLRDQWEQLIIGPLSRLEPGSCPPTIVLVLDALDECGSDLHIRMIMRYLTLARNLSTTRLQIFVTSRPDTAMRCGFREIPQAERQEFVLHEIERQLVDRDLTIFYENRFTTIRVERSLSCDWPGSTAIARLVKIAGGLFIWASAACRYVGAGKHAPRQRLKKLIDGHDPDNGPQTQLDQIYLTVLKGSIQQDYDDEKEREEFLKILCKVVGSLITLRSPLSKHSLANLLHIKADLLTETLADLHPIFMIPKDGNYDIRLHHATIRDFVLDKSRCRDLDFSIDGKKAHRILAENCVRLMSRMLKQNICDLESPSTSVHDISSTRIDHCIPTDLKYACIHWAEHLRQSGSTPRDHDDVHRFLQKHFLHWLEVLSILRESAKVAAIIRMYQSLLQAADNPVQESWVKDLRRFIFSFLPIIEQTPLQIYCAGLAFITPSNALRSHFWHQLHPCLDFLQVIESMTVDVKDEYNYVNDLAFTPDSRQLVAGSLSPWVRRWDVASRKPLSKLEGQDDKVSSVAISDDGARLAAGSDDNSVMVYDRSSDAPQRKLTDHTRWVNTVLFSHNSKLIASGSMDETIRVWKVATGEPIAVLRGNSSCVNDITMSPDSHVIASGTVDQVICLWDIEKKEIGLVLDGHSGPVNSVQYSSDGDTLVSGSDDMTIRLWDVNTGNEIMMLTGHTKKVWSATLSTDGKTIASGSEDKTLRLWDRETGTQKATLRGHTSGVNTVAYSPDGKYLASASFDDEVRLWDARTGGGLGKFKESADDVKSSSVSADDAVLSGIDKDLNDLRLHSDEAALQTSRAHASAVICVAFSPDGQIVASGGHDCVVKLWTKEGTELCKLEGHTKGISHLIFSPDGQRLVSTSMDSTARLWSIEEKKLIHVLDSHSNAVGSAKFSFDGGLLATCSSDKTVRLWDVATGVTKHTLEGHSDTVNAVAFASTGNLLASCSADSTLRLWDISPATQEAIILNGHEDKVNDVSFSLDGTQVISCSSDQSIRVWDMTGAECGKLIGHTHSVSAAAFSSDMRWAVSCSNDKTVRIWDTTTQSAVQTLRLDVELRNVSFSDCGHYINTDRGTLEIGYGTESRSSSPARQHKTLFLTKDWLRCDSTDVIRLPENFRVVSFAVSEDTAVMGHASGAISFVRLGTPENSSSAALTD